MGGYCFRVLAGFIASEFVPVSLRVRLMRALGFKIAKDTLIWPGANLRSRKVTTGSHVFINVGLYHDGCDELVIGKNASIGPNVQILTGTHAVGLSTRRCGEDVHAPIHIGEGCWIGGGVTILPGVTIEAGCIVAAGAVVVGSTLRDGMYAGVPAKRVKELVV